MGEAQSVAANAISLIIQLSLYILVIVALWQVFVKAGVPGWGALIPFYNIYLILKIAGKPGWWILLMLIPFVCLVIAIITYIDLAKKFGKGTGFGLGLAFLPFIFFPILAFSDAEYIGQSSVSS